MKEKEGRGRERLKGGHGGPPTREMRGKGVRGRVREKGKEGREEPVCVKEICGCESLCVRRGRGGAMAESEWEGEELQKYLTFKSREESVSDFSDSNIDFLTGYSFISQISKRLACWYLYRKLSLI